MTKTRKVNFGPNLESSVTFRDKRRSFFNAIWRGVGRFHRFRTDGEKTVSDMTFYLQEDWICKHWPTSILTYPTVP
jgi:hypothetical protein